MRRLNQYGLEHLLFAAYLILFAWLVTKIKFFKNSGLTPSQLIIFFLLKVMAGIFYGWIGIHYGELAHMVDTWGFYYLSLSESDLLKTNPQEFFTTLFQNNYEHGYDGFLSGKNSWWNDIRGTIFIKLLAVINFFSFGHYYINVIFYSFITLIGPIAFYRVMKDVYPTKKLVVLLASFLIPSFLYWTSGIHKDGLVFIALALIIYHFYFGLKKKKFSWAAIFSILLSLVIILALRNYLLILLLPALFAWVLSNTVQQKPIIIFSAVYLLGTLFFFTARYISPKLDFPGSVVAKQQEFLKLKGNSAVPVDEVSPTIFSFISNIPQAFSLSTLRPYPSDVKHLLSLAAAAEINLLLLTFVLFIFYKRKAIAPTPFILFALFLSFSILFTIGYTVNFLGAIVRYRSLVLPLLIVPLAANIDWNRLFKHFSGNMEIKNDI
ncbi:MAG: hypothetical protein ABR503_00265 [Chitinophagaceae bacterium]